MKLLILLALLFFVGTLVACVGGPSTIEDVIPKRTPQLYVSFRTENLPIQQFQAAQLSADWDPNIGTDGQLIGDGPWTGGFSASAGHPLDIFVLDFYDSDGITFYLDGVDGEIELQFGDNFPPHSVYVRRWPATFAVPVDGGGSDMDLWAQYELIAIVDAIIHINDNGNDYIYKVEARWPQGFSFYTFRINSTAV